MDVFQDNKDQLLRAFGISLEMMLIAGVIAMEVGFALAAMRVSPIPLARGFGAAYVRVIRNTPLLVLMFLFAYGLPQLDIRPEFDLNAWFGLETQHRLLNFNVFFVFATTALGLYTAAFICEAVRSGINSVDLGQAEAARAIGMTFGQTLQLVILPQAGRAVIPPLASTLIAMAKNSSVAAGVGVTEAAFLMKKLNNDNPTDLWTIFIGFALFYMAVVAVISLTASVLERRTAVA
jgi:glutamate transport system permease protein